MRPTLLLILAPLLLLETSRPLVAADGTREPSPTTTTERVNFGPGGLVRINGTIGHLMVEGWDQPVVEVTVTRSLSYGHKSKRPDEAAHRVDAIRTVTERNSPMELTISTMVPSSHVGWIPLMPRERTGGVLAEYDIHVPRDSRLTIHHSSGFVTVTGVAGDIDATAARGDIVLWLLPLPQGAYSVDAKTDFGTVSSDFEGSAHNQYLIGERFTSTSSPPSHRVHARMGFGGITIEEILPQAVERFP